MDEGITRPDIADEFRGCSVYSRANSYKFHHTINDTYEGSCEMERKRVDCAIIIKAALAESQEETAGEEA